MNEVKLGDYVTYKGSTYLAFPSVEGKVHITSLSSKLHVNCTSVELTNLRPAKVVEHKNAKYVVTGKDNIFSVKTVKLMKWDSNNWDREAILAAASS